MRKKLGFSDFSQLKEDLSVLCNHIYVHEGESGVDNFKEICGGKCDWRSDNMLLNIFPEFEFGQN